MYKFHITGYVGCSKNDCYRSDTPVDITVHAETQNEAIDKAEKVIGSYISTCDRKVVVKEIDSKTSKDTVESLERENMFLKRQYDIAKTINDFYGRRY
jgi:hypothetical protein